jgi:ATP-binding cassette, subfamily A (ABC1), member 3
MSITLLRVILRISADLVLDEPTTGMDQASRRRVWDLLRRKRSGRVTLLSSHSMDECEVLGDRIAILRAGTLVCVGSALFLKIRFGVGYSLILAAPPADADATSAATRDDVEPHPSRDAMLSLVRQFVPSAIDSGEPRAGEAAHFVLPLTATPSFSGLLSSLDSEWPGEYSLAVTSMEDVFVAATAGGAVQTADDLKDDGSGVHAAPSEPAVTDATCESDAMVAAAFYADPDALRLRGLRLFAAHCTAMLYKRVLMLRRGWRLAACVAIVPLVFLVIAVALSTAGLQSRLAELVSQEPLISIGIGPVPAAVPVFAFKAGSALPSLPLAGVMDALPPGTLVPELIMRDVAAATESVAGRCDIAQGGQNNVTRVLHLMDCALLNSVNGDQSFPTHWAVVWRGLQTPFSGQDSVMTLPTGRVATFDAFVNPSAAHSAPAALNLVNSALLRVMLNASNATPLGAMASGSGTWLHVSSHPLPASDASIARARADITTSDASFIVLAAVVGFAVVSAIAAGVLRREIDVGAKRQQLRAGTSPAAYWMSATLTDLVSSELAAIGVLIAVAAFGPDRITLASGASGRITATAALLVLYPPAALGASYVIAVCIPGAQAAAVVSLGLGVLGAALSFVQSSLRAAPTTCDMALRAASALRYILPSFALGEGLIATATLDSVSSQLAACGDASGSAAVAGSALVPQAAGAPALALGIMAAVWLCMVYATDALPRRTLSRRIVARVLAYGCRPTAQAPQPGGVTAPVEPTDSHTAAEIQSDDLDVAAERLRVTGIVLRDQDAAARGHQRYPGAASGVVLDRVRKVYGPGLLARMTGGRLAAPESGQATFVALEALSLSVPAGTSFGLIGANGAGKSTALSIASGVMPVTSGTAFAGGFDVSLAEAADVGIAIGYCPQHDPLVGALTAAEHLTVYALIAGLPNKQVVNDAVIKALKAFDLQRHAQTCAAAMSGGTKRKLCTAIAFIGRPRVVLLDEPTAGVDIEARRGLWKAMGYSSGSSTAGPSPARVLTTHAVEEAEALCDRVGVLVAGRLRCIGTSLHLRARFGRVLRADIKLSPPLEARVDALVRAAAEAAFDCASTDIVGHPSFGTRCVSLTVLPAVLRAMLAESAHNPGASALEIEPAMLMQHASEQLGFVPTNSEGGVTGLEGSVTGTYGRRRAWLGCALYNSALPPALVQLPLRDVAAWMAEYMVRLEASAALAAALPGSEVLEMHGLTLRLAVPADVTDTGDRGISAAASREGSLAALFAAIESVAASAHIESYTLGSASLETVVAEMLRKTN